MAQGKGGAGARPEFKRARFQEPDPNLCANNIPYTGTFDWFAANGDEIYGTFEGYLTPTGTPGASDVTGGAGRFTGATGHWEAGGQVDFTTEPISFVTPPKVGSILIGTDEPVDSVPLICASQLAALV